MHAALTVLVFSIGFIPYAGEGYALLLPSKWNPSKEKDFPNVELRYAQLGETSVNSLHVDSTPRLSLHDDHTFSYKQ